MNQVKSPSVTTNTYTVFLALCDFDMRRLRRTLTYLGSFWITRPCEFMLFWLLCFVRYQVT